MQICVARMLQESGIFVAVSIDSLYFFIYRLLITLALSKLLSVLAIGFAQGLYAIDAADGETEHGALVANALIQALLQ